MTELENLKVDIESYKLTIDIKDEQIRELELQLDAACRVAESYGDYLALKQENNKLKENIKDWINTKYATNDDEMCVEQVLGELEIILAEIKEG